MTDNRSRIYKMSASSDDHTICMGDDPRLPAMPKKPTLLDFFRHRFDPIDHLLQSARLAKLAGHNETIVTACLLHDIAVCGFIRGDHGYWGEQMVAPYVDPEIAWAVRTHQALRFYPDETVGYSYPETYTTYLGQDYRPDTYIQYEYEQARHHRWYMTARLITIYDTYAFDPKVVVELDDFVDILGRNFKQPDDGLGFDNSPCAHLWRTIMRPNKFL